MNTIKKNEVIYIYYSNVWSFLDSFFKLKYDEIENLTKVWIVGHYKSNTTIFIVKGDKNKLVEEHYKLDANDR